MPLISVILPNYNYARYLRQRIDSILNQSFQDFELIILDDASTDNSCSIIRHYASTDTRIKSYSYKINSGSPFIQWKRGIEKAVGNYIWIAEADDWCESNFLSIMINILRQNGKIGIAYSNSYIADKDGCIKNTWDYCSHHYIDKVFSRDFSMNGRKYIEQYLIHRNTIPNASSVVFKKKLYEIVGGIDTQIEKCGDWLLWMKILNYCDISFNSKPLNYFRRHSQSVILKKIINSQYREQYDFTMRSFFISWLRKHKIKLNRKAMFQNKLYISNDIGNKGLWLLKHKKKFKGWFYILRASLIPTFRSGFLKKAFRY